ncbi:ankyrin repeat family protein [Orientia tsutsugamushi str. UT144]|uniref:Ankyrin repeat family protein n=1 Tax=Orientia tsutsugamushi str. UT144 TaxID=1441384 RepID=A0A0F3RID7_ORITS|nr:ankyrin repeat domain-containing protein [Orientia tsutsugamushi]KJW06175.1 ankyrin repeat family protein [Orientia tsutsugamushi str. UT144]
MIFIGKVINIKSIDKYCSTPLHCAAHYCDIVTIKLLLKKGANLNVLDVTHSTPFADAYRMFMVDQETNIRHKFTLYFRN